MHQFCYHSCLFSDVLQEAGHKVEFVKIPYRNALEVMVNGEIVFQCDQDKLDFGKHFIIKLNYHYKYYLYQMWIRNEKNHIIPLSH